MPTYVACTSLTMLASLFLVSCHAPPRAGADRFPADLRIAATSGSLMPGEANRSLLIEADGSATYTRFRPDDPAAPPLEENTFRLSTAQMDAIWDAVEDHDFFSLAPHHAARDVEDGVFVSLTVTAHGRTHRVEVRNETVPPVRRILDVLNEATPGGNDLIFNYMR